jgi:hypothetical protein
LSKVRQMGYPLKRFPLSSGMIFTALIGCAALALAGPVPALAISRDTVLARGQRWVNDPVPYSQSDYHDGYRTDCSGYVSMAWQTGTSWTTATMHDIAFSIPADQLKPGDVLLKASTATSTGHVRLFYGWANDEHTVYIAYEETRYTGFDDGTKSSVKLLSTDIADGYKPYRYNKIIDSPPPWNTVRNPAFDVWSSSVPIWWVYGTNASGTSWQKRTDKVGSSAFALGLTNLNSNPSSTIVTQHTSAVEPGKTYTLSALVGTTANPAAVSMALLVYDSANNLLIAPPPTTTGDAWGIGAAALKPMSLVVPMPAGASRAVISLGLVGSGAAGGTMVIDDVKLYVTSPMPVYRFFNRKIGGHFYTASGVERDVVAETLGSSYAYEGIAYGVPVSAANATPLYRFFNRKIGTHFYTTSPAERDDVIKRLSGTYTFENEAFRVSDTAVNGATPVYRFFSPSVGTHFYTASAYEASVVRTTLSKYYNDEGIGFYLAP